MANAFWQTVLRFDRTKIAPEIAFRNTAGIVLPLIIGGITGDLPAGAVAALGALNVSYSDSRDPYAVRARRMLVASGLVGVAVTAGALSGHDNASAVITAALWAFAVGMLVVLGQKAADLGAVTLMTLLIFAARSLSVSEALWSGVLAIGGGLGLTILSLASWAVKPHEPERRIVAELYAELSKIAVSPAGPNSAPPASGLMTGAQEALASLAAEHSPDSDRLTFLLNQAERIRLALLTLRRLAKRIQRDPAGRTPAPRIQLVLESASRTLQSISDSIPQAKTLTGLTEFDNANRLLREQDLGTPGSMFAAMIRDARYQTEALAGQLRAAAGLVTPAYAGVSPFRRGDPSRRVFKLRANLSMQSTAFRHAIRVALSVGLGDAIGRHFNIQRSYWLPMTVAIVLKPDFTSTFSRGILRIGGTLAGLLAATALFYLLPTGPAADIALIALFAFILRRLGPANYGFLVIGVSGVVVLLIAFTGVNPKDAIIARAVNTIAGGALALAAYWVWPTWEKTQAGPVLGEMLDRYREWFHEIVRVYAGEPESQLNAKRIPARLARTNAEASVARFSAEPGASSERTDLLNEMLVSSHAFVRAGMSIESFLYLRSSPRPQNAVLQLAGEVEVTLGVLAGALRAGGRLPDNLPDLRDDWTRLNLSDDPYSLTTSEMDRIVTIVNTLREQVVKWNKSR